MGLKILILEDSELDAELILRTLKNSDLEFAFELTSKKEDFKKHLLEWNPDIVLSDYNLRSFTGSEMLAFSKQKAPDIPFIIVSGSMNKEMEVSLLENRADDVIKKNNLNRLPYAIQREINKSLDRRKLRKTLEEKEVLLAEVHHRVKNNMALISSFLELERFNYESGEVYTVLGNHIRRIHSIAIIHEQVYRQGNLSRINFADFVKQLINYVYSEMSDNLTLRFNNQASTDTLNINQAVPLALLVSEIFSETYKQSNEQNYKNNGEVKFSFGLQQEQVYLSFSDPHLFSYFNSFLNEYSEIITVLNKQLGSTFNLDEKTESLTISFQRRETKGSASAL